MFQEAASSIGYHKIDQVFREFEFRIEATSRPPLFVLSSWLGSVDIA